MTTERFHNLSVDKRNRVFAAIGQHFMRCGYRAMSTNDVARDAGISKGALFSYFPTKQIMVLAFIDHEIERASANFAEPEGHLIDFQCLVGIVRRNIEFVPIYRKFREFVEDQHLQEELCRFSSERDRVRATVRAADKFIVEPLSRYVGLHTGKTLDHEQARFIADFMTGPHFFNDCKGVALDMLNAALLHVIGSAQRPRTAGGAS